MIVFCDCVPTALLAIGMGPYNISPDIKAACPTTLQQSQQWRSQKFTKEGVDFRTDSESESIRFSGVGTESD